MRKVKGILSKELEDARYFLLKDEDVLELRNSHGETWFATFASSEAINNEANCYLNKDKGSRQNGA